MMWWETHNDLHNFVLRTWKGRKGSITVFTWTTAEVLSLWNPGLLLPFLIDSQATRV
jgi:hypothetical protein